MKKIINFYMDGFKGMRVGKKLWLIIAIKLFIFFVIMKWLFFPNILQKNFSNDKQRAEHVLHNLLQGR